MGLMGERTSLPLLQGSEGTEDDRDREWLRVFSHFQPRLVSFFSNRCDSEDDLDGMLSTLWVRAFLHIRTLRSSNALWSWLTTIGNNLLRDDDRRSKRSPEVRLDDVVVAADKAAQFIEGLSTSERTDSDPASLLEKLSTEEREFVELYAVDGLSHDEIAQRLGLASAAASRQRLRRIRTRISNDS